MGVAALTAPAASASAPCGSSGAYSTAAGVDTCTYTATGEDTFTVPAGVVQVSVNAIGGAGGAGGEDLDGTFALVGGGGQGAYVTASLDVTPATTLYVEVGGDGGNATGDVAGGTCATGTGGENGGAPGGYTLCVGEPGGGGGGASDVQTCSVTDETCLSSVNAGSGDPRLVVAGGGGGGGGVFQSSLPQGLGGSAGAASAGTGAGDGGGCESGDYSGDNGGDSDTGSGGGDGGPIYVVCLGLTPPFVPGSDGSAGEGGMTSATIQGGGGGGGGGGYIGGGSGVTVFTGGGGGAGSSFGPAGVTAVPSEATPSVSISWTTTPCGAPAITGSTAVVTCSYDGTDGTDGTPQTWTVPTGVTQATFDADGGQGGGLPPDVPGGLGGEAQGTFTVNPGDTYDIVAAGAGQEQPQSSSTSPGGYGGGGEGATSGDDVAGDGGGGASTVALSGDLLVVAGGGGGASPGCNIPTPCGTGGAGGGTDGDAGTSIGGPDAGQGGAGGTQSGPGVGADGAGSGSTLQGGGGATSDFGLGGGGGGGGYFGGAGGGGSAGGGGGSGYVDSSALSSSQQTAVQSGNGVVTITYQLPLASPSITSIAGPASVTLSNEGTVLSDEAILSGGNAPTGTITFNLFYDGSATPVDTQYVTVTGDGLYSVPYDLPTDQTVTGSYQWDVSYSGDDQNNGAADNGDPNEVETVSAATPTLVTTPSPLLATIGNTPTTLTDSATLAGGYYPTGSINFTLYYDGGATPVDTESVTVAGNGTYVTPEGYTLPQGTETVVGDYQWNASYDGDGNNVAASDGDIHEAAFVSPGSESTSTSLTVAHPSVTYGSPTTEAFSGRVTGQASDGYPEGSVNVTYGPSATLLCNAPLTGGANDSASYTCPASSLLAAGDYSDVVATYVPSGSSSSNPNYLYLASTSSPAKSFNVFKDLTSTSVTVAPSLVTFGNESVAVFNVKVTAHNGESVPSGEDVTVVAGFASCVAPLTNGLGHCSIANTALPAGAYLVGANYPGDSNLFGSIGVAGTLLLVGRDSTVTSLTETPPGLTYGHESVALFSVHVATHYGEAVPNGEHVVVSAGPASCLATLTAGTGTCAIANTALGVGSYPVVASYLGDGDLSGSSASLGSRIAVAQDTTSTAVSASGTSAVLGHESSVLFSVVVTTHYGEAVPNGEHATVHVGSASCPVTLVGGHGSCVLANNALGVGTYSVSASYGGDPNLIGSTVTSASSFSVKV
jgi:hypothetical protein